MWHNAQPSDADVRWLDDRGDDFVSHVATLVEGLADTQRLSVKLDNRSGRWLAILFDDLDAATGDVHALSVRGSDAFLALVLLHYFHHVKFQGFWRENPTEVSGKFG